MVLLGPTYICGWMTWGLMKLGREREREREREDPRIVYVVFTKISKLSTLFISSGYTPGRVFQLLRVTL